MPAATRKPIAQSPLCDGNRFDPCSGPHRVEEAVQRELLAHPELRFSSLVVRRVRNGVCLEGVLEVDVDQTAPEVSEMARAVAGVDRVLNHLVIQRPRSKFAPAKG